MSTAARRVPPALVALSPGELVSAGGGLHLVRGVAGWLAGVDAALRAGLPGLLLREPGLLDRDLLELMQELAPRLLQAGAWFGLHDAVHLAAAGGAHGVHLGFRSLEPTVARGVLAPDLGLGLSTHAGDALERSADCDWRTFGPIYATPSKRGLLEPTGLDALGREVRAAQESGGAAVLALGGLTPARAPEVLATGAHGLVVRGALLGAKDPGRATASFLRALAGASR